MKWERLEPLRRANIFYFVGFCFVSGGQVLVRPVSTIYLYPNGISVYVLLIIFYLVVPRGLHKTRRPCMVCFMKCRSCMKCPRLNYLFFVFFIECFCASPTKVMSF